MRVFLTGMFLYLKKKKSADYVIHSFIHGAGANPRTHVQSTHWID